MKKITAILCLSAFVIVAACNREDSSSSNLSANSLDHLSSNINLPVPHQASLIRNLPEQAVAYIRIPSLLGTFIQPQSDALQPAMLAEPMQQQVALIAQGLHDNLLNKIDNQTVRELIELILNKQTAPIEFAILAGVGGVMTPEFLIQTEFDLESVEQFSTMLNHLTTISQGQLQITSEPDQQGAFQLNAGQLNVLGYFDANSKQLALYAGQAVTESNLSEYRDGSLETRTDAYAFEQTFDTTGTNLAIWADTRTLWQQLSSLIPPNDRFSLENLNLHNTEFVYAGSATKDGHSSFRVMLKQAGDSQNLLHFKSSDSVRNVKVSLPVSFAATLPFPNKDHVEQIILIDEASTDEAKFQAEFNELRESLLDLLNFDIEMLGTAFGPSGVVVGDQAGIWFALPIDDADAFDEMIAWTVDSLGAKLDTKIIDGTEITHYNFPSLSRLVIEQTPGLQEFENHIDWLFQLANADSTHLYWQKEQSNLIIASVPQILISRQRHLSKYSLDEWLSAHKVDWNGTLLSILVESNKLPERIYTFYLQSIQILSDIAGVNPNLMSMPLAEDLQLPNQGRLGLQVKTASEITSLQFDYEQSMVDYFFGSGTVATVAAVGVLAAVAIPAYQDYTIRAKVMDTITSAGLLKQMLAEFYTTYDRYPSIEESESFYFEAEDAMIQFNAETQAIEIYFNDNISDLDEAMIMLVPEIDESGYFTWRCENISAHESQIPSQCR